MASNPPINNVIEEALREVPQQQTPDMNAALIQLAFEAQKAKTELAKLYISDKKYKTEVNSGQRDTIPILAYMALCPFESTALFLKRIGKTNKEIGETLKSQEVPFLKAYVPQWLELGIALDREGRKEDERVLAALVSNELEVRTNANNSNNQQNRL